MPIKIIVENIKLKIIEKLLIDHIYKKLFPYFKKLSVYRLFLILYLLNSLIKLGNLLVSIFLCLYNNLICNFISGNENNLIIMFVIKCTVSMIKLSEATY